MVVFGVLRLILLILWATTSERDGLFGRVTIAANTFNLIDSVALCVIGFLEHRKSIRPSTLITLYLLISTSFDAVECRTLWLNTQDQRLRTIAIVVSVSIFVKVGILFLEAVGKMHFLNATWNVAPPESLSGAINRTVFWWLNSLFLQG